MNENNNNNNIQQYMNSTTTAIIIWYFIWNALFCQHSKLCFYIYEKIYTLTMHKHNHPILIWFTTIHNPYRNNIITTVLPWYHFITVFSSHHKHTGTLFSHAIDNCCNGCCCTPSNRYYIRGYMYMEHFPHKRWDKYIII